jgi:hypothetical protein
MAEGETEEPHARQRIAHRIANKVHFRTLGGAREIQKLHPVADRAQRVT